jgi:hypothetical protein
MKDFKLRLVSEELFMPILVLILLIHCFNLFKGTVPYFYSCENGQVMENTKHRQFIYRPDGKLLRYVAQMNTYNPCRELRIFQDFSLGLRPI